MKTWVDRGRVRWLVGGLAFLGLMLAPSAAQAGCGAFGHRNILDPARYARTLLAADTVPPTVEPEPVPAAPDPASPAPCSGPSCSRGPAGPPLLPVSAPTVLVEQWGCVVPYLAMAGADRCPVRFDDARQPLPPLSSSIFHPPRD
jgi:hypothetical protein